jgi:hypothetical protein
VPTISLNTLQYNGIGRFARVVVQERMNQNERLASRAARSGFWRLAHRQLLLSETQIAIVQR